MTEKRTEACGRCSLSSVAEVATDGDDGDGEEEARRDPFAGGHIEVDEAAVRAVSPSAWLGGVKQRIDDAVTTLTYGR